MPQLMHSERTLRAYDELASSIQNALTAALVDLHRQLMRREQLEVEPIRLEAARILALCAQLDTQVAVDPTGDLS